MRLATLFASSLLLLSANRALAVPLYYTLDGALFDVQSQGVPSAHGVGDAVHYVLMVDKDLPGYVQYNGYTQPKFDNGAPGVDASWLDFFYAGYIGGDAIPDDGAGRDPSMQAGHFFGYDYNANGFPIGVLSVSNSDGSGYDYLEVLSAGSYFSDWTVGKSGLIGTNIMEDDAGTRWVLQSTLAVTAISDVNPYGTAAGPEAVPEPTTLALFGLGFIGLALAGRKFRV